jgi:quinol monooxygenase YgiN
MKRYFLPYLLLCIGLMMASNSNAQIDNKIYRMAKIKVDINQLEKYKFALKEQMNTALKVEPGVLSYTAVADKKDISQITILEVYANGEAYQSHIATPHFKKYKDTVKEMVLSLELLDIELLEWVHKDF